MHITDIFDKYTTTIKVQNIPIILRRYFRASLQLTPNSSEGNDWSDFFILCLKGYKRNQSFIVYSCASPFCSTCFSDSSMLSHVSIVFSFLFLNSIPLNCNTICKIIHPSVDICRYIVVSSLRPLWIKL